MIRAADDQVEMYFHGEQLADAVLAAGSRWWSADR